MNTPTIYKGDGSEPLDGDELAALRQSVINWASEDAWRFICQIGLVANRMSIEDGPEGFEWIFFKFGQETFAWNPEDGVDEKDGTVALAAAVAVRLLLEEEQPKEAYSCPK